MRSRVLALVGLIVLLIIVIALASSLRMVTPPTYTPPTQTPPTNTPPTNSPGQVFCTQEAKMCPDGSYVGRTGPNCEFAACPAPTTVPGQKATIETRLQVGASALGVRITPYEVLEDSRCPIDVTCIQAGTVRVRTTVDSASGTSQQVFVLNQPVTTEAEIIELTSVIPATKHSQVTVKPEDYRFTFAVTKR